VLFGWCEEFLESGAAILNRHSGDWQVQTLKAERGRLKAELGEFTRPTNPISFISFNSY
jgi:hypothetical protein